MHEQFLENVVFGLGFVFSDDGLEEGLGNVGYFEGVTVCLLDVVA